MDDTALHERLRRIEHRQYLVLLLVGAPYLYIVADRVGFAVSGVLYVVGGVLVFGFVVASRRRNRDDKGQ